MTPVPVMPFSARPIHVNTTFVKKWMFKMLVSTKMSYLSEYASYRPETGVKIFLGSIAKTFSLTPQRFSVQKKCFRKAKNFLLHFTVYCLPWHGLKQARLSVESHKLRPCVNSRRGNDL